MRFKFETLSRMLIKNWESNTVHAKAAKINAQRQSCKRVLEKSKHQCPATVATDRTRNKKNRVLYRSFLVAVAKCLHTKRRPSQVSWDCGKGKVRKGVLAQSKIPSLKTVTRVLPKIRNHKCNPSHYTGKTPPRRTWFFPFSFAYLP